MKGLGLDPKLWSLLFKDFSDGGSDRKIRKF